MDMDRVRTLLAPVADGTTGEPDRALRAVAAALLEIAEGVHDLRLAAARQDLRGRGR